MAMKLMVKMVRVELQNVSKHLRCLIGFKDKSSISNFWPLFDVWSRIFASSLVAVTLGETPFCFMLLPYDLKGPPSSSVHALAQSSGTLAVQHVWSKGSLLQVQP